MYFYKALVRPYTMDSLSGVPTSKTNQEDLLENVQERAAKLVGGLRDLRYEESLK